MTTHPNQATLLAGFVHFDHSRTGEQELKADEVVMVTAVSRYLHDDIGQAGVA